MGDSNLFEKELENLKGRFNPGQLSSFMNMGGEELDENYLVEFHERFHYLQHIFTPYGHLKWAHHRTYTSDIINSWRTLSKLADNNYKIPIAGYITDNDIPSIRVPTNVHLLDITNAYFDLMLYIEFTSDLKTFIKLIEEEVAPKFKIGDDYYYFNGIDVIESWAKYEEAMLAYAMEEIPLEKIIDPEKLPRKYYSALLYFITVLGEERIGEFPVVCELSLAFCHIPKFDDINNFKVNHPAWRFLKIVDFLKSNDDIGELVLFDNQSFYTYTNRILEGCNFESWSTLWDSAIEYASETDLKMAEEMLMAIDYKVKNPWMLSYPMREQKKYFSKEFRRFQPLFTVTRSEVYFNLNDITPMELIIENHHQALAMQICGNISERCIYKDMLQCGISYFGTKGCNHFLNGECDGHIDSESELPPFELDEKGNILSGCILELLIQDLGTSIKNIKISDVSKKITLADISKKLKGLEK